MVKYLRDLRWEQKVKTALSLVRSSPGIKWGMICEGCRAAGNSRHHHTLPIKIDIFYISLYIYFISLLYISVYIFFYLSHILYFCPPGPTFRSKEASCWSTPPPEQIPSGEHIHPPMQFQLVPSWWHLTPHSGEVPSTAESPASPHSKDFYGGCSSVELSLCEKGRYISVLKHFHFHPAVISQGCLSAVFRLLFLFPLLPEGLVEQ